MTVTLSVTTLVLAALGSAVVAAGLTVLWQKWDERRERTRWYGELNGPTIPAPRDGEDH